MSYQLIRGAIEMATASALVDAGIDKVFFDNVSYAAPDATTSFAEIAITFSEAKQDVVGCPGVDDFVEYNGRKWNVVNVDPQYSGDVLYAAKIRAEC